MSPAFGQCSLFLCPRQYNFVPEDISQLVSSLQEIGFISQKIKTQQHAYNYFAGDSFLDYIAFMGCSPAIQFEAADNQDNFCHIKIHQFELPQLIHSKIQSKAPHCPMCKKPVKAWFNNKSTSTIMCNQCHSSANIEEFNWRKMAGYARLFIEITDIFPKEAIPQQLLLDKLAGKFETEWQYFYACEN